MKELIPICDPEAAFVCPLHTEHPGFEGKCVGCCDYLDCRELGRYDIDIELPTSGTTFMSCCTVHAAIVLQDKIALSDRLTTMYAAVSLDRFYERLDARRARDAGGGG
jgi:hypothetical protein